MAPDRTLHSERLILRPIEMADAPLVARWCNEREVSRFMLTMPHPYTLADAEEWLSVATKEDESPWAIVHRNEALLIGTIGLHPNAAHRRTAVGYWLARPYWGQGLTTEALRAVIDHCFAGDRYDRVFAHHNPDNPASGAVLRNAGMRYEGRLRSHWIAQGERVDSDYWGILRDEYEPLHTASAKEGPGA